MKDLDKLFLLQSSCIYHVSFCPSRQPLACLSLCLLTLLSAVEQSLRLGTFLRNFETNKEIMVCLLLFAFKSWLLNAQGFWWCRILGGPHCSGRPSLLVGELGGLLLTLLPAPHRGAWSEAPGFVQAESWLLWKRTCTWEMSVSTLLLSVDLPFGEISK